MNLSDILAGYVPALSRDLQLFLPELVICGTIVAMLLARTVVSFVFHARLIALAGTAIALAVSVIQWKNGVLGVGSGATSRTAFDGLLVVDLLANYLRLLVLSFTFLTIVLSSLTRIPDAEDSVDFFTLLLGASLGMLLTGEANHLLMIFVAVEMASVPSYALAGFLKGRKQSSEAALKYVVYGGAAAGVMLYGLSLLAGMFGSLHVPTLAQSMAVHFATPQGREFDPLLLISLCLILVGFAFKLSAVPFHFWCPDVFEGAAAEVAAFLSVASKGAAVVLLARFTLAICGTYAGAPFSPIEWEPSVAAMKHYVAPLLAVMGAVTCSFGNLAAFNQTNVKRMLAYSTIAHAGYMIIALSTLTTAGLAACLFYLVIYLFMNLGAFAVIAFIRNRTGSEEMSAFEGLIYKAPVLTVCMIVFLVSLLGIPPMAGFWAKVQILLVLNQARNYVLLGIVGLNTVVSAVYYFGLIRLMVLRGDSIRQPRLETTGQQVFATLLAAPMLILFVFFNAPLEWANFSAGSLEGKARAAIRPAPNPKAIPAEVGG